MEITISFFNYGCVIIHEQEGHMRYIAKNEKGVLTLTNKVINEPYKVLDGNNFIKSDFINVKSNSYDYDIYVPYVEIENIEIIKEEFSEYFI